MNKALAFSVTTLSVLLLMTGTLTQVPTALAHHRDGHTAGPGGGGGGGPLSSTIDLIQCGGGGTAKWIDTTVTYAIDNQAGLSSTVINAVNTGVQEWNTVGTLNADVVVPYTLVRDDALLTDADPNTPDVTILVFNKITPGYILGASFVSCPDTATGIVSHEIWLGVKGLKTNGVKNLAAHEMGHSIGLGHTTNNNNDLMGPSLDSSERSNLTCPSDLDVGALSASGTS
ncbi:MAG: matrixin family metalloprotease, partial [Nitrososphaerales archaeon]